MRTNRNLLTAAIGLLGLVAAAFGAAEFGTFAIESVSVDLAGTTDGGGETEEMHW